MASDPFRPAPARRPIDVIVSVVRFVGPLRLVGAACATAVLVATAVWLLQSPPAPIEASLPFATAAGADDRLPPVASSTADGASGHTVSGTMVVHVAGAVVKPGLVELPAEARVADAIAAAGGPSADADPSLVNLAQRVADGQRIYLPRQGESVLVADGGDGDGASAGPTPLIDINRATARELEQLPGIGPATAAAIVAHRERSGPFRHVDDLLDVRGIGPAKLEAIRELVRT